MDSRETRWRLHPSDERFPSACPQGLASELNGDGQGEGGEGERESFGRQGVRQRDAQNDAAH